MRMIPPRAREKTTGSEQKVFSLLHRLNLWPEAIALSSLNLAEHEYKRWGEIDFVLVLQNALLAIEVKGGIVTCTDGIWRFEDKWGRIVEKLESPMAQAQSGYSSLIGKYLEPGLGANLVQKISSGFCVIFPGSSRREVDYLTRGPEMPSDLVGTKEDCVDSNAFGKFLLRVIGYWDKHAKRKRVGWSPAEARQVASFLRPSFDRVPPLSISLAHVREEQCVLTEDQYHFLDYLEKAPRVLCTGGAGCGKTFYASEPFSVFPD